jgi:7-carboxy-7-deazaguanine synthase
MSGRDNYPVHEVFHTFQGEGMHMGRRAFFIRLFGCPVQCPWCDSAGTWHKDYIPKHIVRNTARELTDMAEQSGADIVVITGGEPTIHDLSRLTGELHIVNKLVHLETSGAFPLTGSFDHITLSPKRWKLPLPEVIHKAREFKFIIERPEDIAFYWELIAPHYPENRHGPVDIWLHPEWSQRDNVEVLGAICEAVKGSSTFRAGWQLHKFYRVDLKDQRSQPAAPLGGDPTRGY